MIRTRFAPSPTGWLHIGGVRTALFSWLFAKSQKGEFVIRVDDTDTTRSSEEYCSSIISALNLLGMNSDKDIVYQSKRFDVYIDKIEKLLEENKAYYDKVEINEKTKDTDLEIQFNNRLNKEGHVIRFRNQKEKKIKLKDLIHGEIIFEPKTFHDVVILRSNGVPTYNLTSVVDDISMDISHVIRGDDHLSNTAIQINMFNAFNGTVPQFAHLPMIHGKDGKRLSKRHGAVDINTFIDDGYLREALINYLARTGWSHGDQEIFSMDELKELFTIDRVTKSAAIFDHDKLNWLNQYYIKNKEIDEIAEMILPYLDLINIKVDDRNYLEDILRLGIERDFNLKNIAEGLQYYFTENIDYKNDISYKPNSALSVKILEKVLERFGSIEFSDKKLINENIKNVCQELTIKFKDIGPVLRFGLTGRLKAPSIDALCYVLGKDKSLKRLSNFKLFLESN